MDGQTNNANSRVASRLKKITKYSFKWQIDKRKGVVRKHQ